MNLCGGKWPVAIEKKQKDKQTNKQTTKTKLLRKKAWLFLGCVRLGNLDLHFKIRISDLQSYAKSRYPFLNLRFYRSIGKSEKIDLKNCP